MLSHFSPDLNWFKSGLRTFISPQQQFKSRPSEFKSTQKKFSVELSEFKSWHHGFKSRLNKFTSGHQKFKSTQQTVPGDPAQGWRKPQSPAFSAKFEKCELFRSGPVGCRAISPPSPRHTPMP